MLNLMFGFLLTCCAIAGLGVGCASGPKVGSQAPDFVAVDQAGRGLSSQDLHGGVTVLYFWATWCAPCAVSGPGVQRIHERYTDGQEVKVLGVHFNDIGNPSEYAVQHGYTFTIIPNGQRVVDAYDIKKIPTIVIVGRDGSVLYKQTGYKKGDEEPIALLIDEHLGGEM